jgi:sec-independent protein translocase protein TatB
VFNIGSGELMVIAVAALLILGPSRLPELARGLGKFLREFRRQTDDIRNTVEREFYRMDTELSKEPPPGAVKPVAPVAAPPVVLPAELKAAPSLELLPVAAPDAVSVHHEPTPAPSEAAPVAQSAVPPKPEGPTS